MIIKSFKYLALVCAIVLLLACHRSHETSAVPASDPPLSDAQVVVGNTGLKPFPSALLGVNLTWEEESLHLTEANGLIKESVRSRFEEMGSTVLRYPGGTLADIFDADNAALPYVQRAKVKELLGSRGPDRDLVFGFDEMLGFRTGLKADLVFTVNLWSENDPVKAARAARYFLEADHSLSADHLWIELGNEPYLTTEIPGFPADALSPQEWASRARAYREAVAAVDKRIRFLVPLRLESVNGVPMTTKPGFLAAVLPLLKDAAGNPIFDAVAVHDAYMPVVTRLNTPDRDMSLGLAAGSRALAEVLDQYATVLSNTFRKTVPLALTEWHPVLKQSLLDMFISQTPYTSEQALAALASDQRVNGQMGFLYTADVLSMLAYRSDIVLSTIFAGTGNYIFGTIAKGGELRSPGLALKVLKTFEGSTLVSLDIQSPRIATPNVSLVRAMDDLPVITGLAAVRDGKTQVLLLNRDPDSAHLVRLVLPESARNSPGGWNLTTWSSDNLLSVKDADGVHVPKLEMRVWHKGDLIRMAPGSLSFIQE